MATLQEIQSIAPYEFEKLIAELWETKGYETEVRKQSKDKGIDIDAERAGLSEKIQVKRYSGNNKIGSNDVRKYATIYQQTNANNVVLVTSGKATDSAEELARDLSVDLIDGEELIHQLESSSVDLNDYTGSSGSESIKDSGIDKAQSRQDSSSKSYREVSGPSEPDTYEVPQLSKLEPNEEAEAPESSPHTEAEASESATHTEAEKKLEAGMLHIFGVIGFVILSGVVQSILGIERGTTAYDNVIALDFIMLGALTIGFGIKDNESIRIGTWILGLFYLSVGLLDLGII